MTEPTAAQHLRASLRSWAILNGSSLATIATAVGVSPGLLSLWIGGQRRIGHTVAQEIEVLTGGAARPEDWPWMWHEAEGREYRKPGAGREQPAKRGAE